MRKVILFVIALLGCAGAHALYLGNPAEPEIIEKGVFAGRDYLLSLKIGYQGDYVFDRRLKMSGGVQGGIDEFEMLTNQGVVTLTAMDRMEVFGSVGAMGISMACRPHFDHKRREFQTDDDLTWGVGGRIIVLKWGNSSLGMEGGYQWANPHLRWDSLSGVSLRTHADMHYREWQVGLGFAHQIDIFNPYLAVKYSHVHASLVQLNDDLEMPHRNIHLRSRTYYGLVLGCTLSNGKFFDVTAECRLVDEQAISLVGNIRF